jgi:hypothetical protein
MINEYLQICFSGANLPASILLVLVMAYWLMALLAGLDLDFFDFDLDLDLDAEPNLLSAVGIGFLTFRFLNLGRIPFMIWMSVFTVTYWLLSILLDRLLDDPEHRETLLVAAQYGIRNFAIAVVLTKIFTQPLRGKFEAKEPHPAEELIGNTCVITTSEANERFGEAHYATGGAPLVLTVRTTDGKIAKGESAEIVDFEPDGNIYFVRKTNPEV